MPRGRVAIESVSVLAGCGHCLLGVLAVGVCRGSVVADGALRDLRGSTCDGERFFVSFSSTMVGGVVLVVVEVDVDEGVEWVEDGVVELEHFCGRWVYGGEDVVGPGGKKAGVGVRWQATLQGKRAKNKGEL